MEKQASRGDFINTRPEKYHQIHRRAPTPKISKKKKRLYHQQTWDLKYSKHSKGHLHILRTIKARVLVLGDSTVNICKICVFVIKR